MAPTPFNISDRVDDGETISIQGYTKIQRDVSKMINFVCRFKPQNVCFGGTSASSTRGRNEAIYFSKKCAGPFSSYQPSKCQVKSASIAEKHIPTTRYDRHPQSPSSTNTADGILQRAKMFRLVLFLSRWDHQNVRFSPIFRVRNAKQFLALVYEKKS
ncbi:MAG: hypothetical protein UY04_C0024G0018 [Parcubacteria group bacterium GW2011_GWA2_47_7]|nr:MAG: hypothetical protein UY04_C0024G0018 [Parcubacteria group bacterium GW2011_GWA2_47_7]